MSAQTWLSDLAQADREQRTKDEERRIWTLAADGTKVCEISMLEGYGKIELNSIVTLPNGKFDLCDAVPDRTEDGIAGWRFTFRGQHYLVIND